MKQWQEDLVLTSGQDPLVWFACHAPDGIWASGARVDRHDQLFAKVIDHWFSLYFLALLNVYQYFALITTFIFYYLLCLLEIST